MEKFSLTPDKPIGLGLHIILRTKLNRLRCTYPSIFLLNTVSHRGDNVLNSLEQLHLTEIGGKPDLSLRNILQSFNDKISLVIQVSLAHENSTVHYTHFLLKKPRKIKE